MACAGIADQAEMGPDCWCVHAVLVLVLASVAVFGVGLRGRSAGLGRPPVAVLLGRHAPDTFQVFRLGEWFRP